MILSVLLLIVLVSSSFAQHYYGNGQQIPLQIDSTKLVLKFDSSFGPINEEGILNSINRILTAYIEDPVNDGFIICSLSTSNNYFSFIDSLRQINTIDFVEPFYIGFDSSGMLVGTAFYVAFDSELSYATIKSICSSNNVTVGNKIAGLYNVYVLYNNPIINQSTVDLANLFYEMPVTRYAHPEFDVRIEPLSYNLYDFYHDYQPHTKKVIGSFNNASVWDFAGLTENIINVAVIDDGVTSHEDLPASRILPGKDFALGGSDATPGPYFAHGMSVAGIIGASHTTDVITGQLASTGMISLNPNTNIVPIKIYGDTDFDYYTPMPDSAIAEAIYLSWYEYNADILSNSWAYTNPSFYSDVIADAIMEATLMGRNGLGSPVIFGSGNTRKPIGVRFPALAPASFSVGATQLDDYIWGYSSYGPTLDIVAPSGNTCLRGDVWSLDQMSGNGLNNSTLVHFTNCNLGVTWDCPPSGNDRDYNCKFGGTSAAAPIVSGVASLILAKDPTLTAQQVYEILRNTAVKDLDWGTIPDTPNVEYGYGRVDAFRAILSLSRGDVNNSRGMIDISDLVFILPYMFEGGPAPFPSILLADVDCTGEVDIQDLVYLVAFMFDGGAAPPYPCYEFQ